MDAAPQERHRRIEEIQRFVEKYGRAPTWGIETFRAALFGALDRLVCA